MSTEMNDRWLDIYAVVATVPEGRVTTYGAIAQFLGIKSGARMVGYALNHVHASPHNVPAHRVVNRNGQLSGKHHFGGDRMEELLKAEGVDVKDDTVQNFKQLFWKPE